VEAAGASYEGYVAVFAFGGLGAVPEASAAVNALFSLEGGEAVGALGDGLARAHGYAGFLAACGAEFQVAEDYVVGETGHGLDLATDEERILLGDEEAAVEGNLRPATDGEQGIVQGAVFGDGSGGGLVKLRVMPSIPRSPSARDRGHPKNLLAGGDWVGLEAEAAVG